jgi:hypothetical protein
MDRTRAATNYRALSLGYNGSEAEVMLMRSEKSHVVACAFAWRW